MILTYDEIQSGLSAVCYRAGLRRRYQNARREAAGSVGSVNRLRGIEPPPVGLGVVGVVDEPGGVGVEGPFEGLENLLLVPTALFK